MCTDSSENRRRNTLWMDHWSSERIRSLIHHDREICEYYDELVRYVSCHSSSQAFWSPNSEIREGLACVIRVLSDSFSEETALEIVTSLFFLRFIIPALARLQSIRKRAFCRRRHRVWRVQGVQKYSRGGLFCRSRDYCSKSQTTLLVIRQKWVSYLFYSFFSYQMIMLSILCGHYLWNTTVVRWRFQLCHIYVSSQGHSLHQCSHGP